MRILLNVWIWSVPWNAFRSRYGNKNQMQTNLAENYFLYLMFLVIWHMVWNVISFALKWLWIHVILTMNLMTVNNFCKELFLLKCSFSLSQWTRPTCTLTSLLFTSIRCCRGLGHPSSSSTSSRWDSVFPVPETPRPPYHHKFRRKWYFLLRETTKM